MITLFVYGSLLSGQANHRVLSGARFIGTATSEPRYALVDLGPYPGIIDGDAGIVGELYEVDDDHLARIDRFEGSAFERREILLRGQRAEAYFLRGSKQHYRRIDSGDWRRR
jgi:gamma-glutamylaminecyclotransferase